MSVKRIKKFLIEVQQLAEKSEVILFHLSLSQRRFSIWSDDQWTVPDETAATIYEAAKSQAEALGGPQRFMACAYDRTDPEESRDHPLRSVAFAVEPGMGTASDPTVSEPPTGEGLLSQLMRHNQEMHRQNNVVIGSLTHYMARTIDRQAETIEKLMGDRMANITVMEEMLSQKHERDLKNQQTIAKIERDKDIFGKVMQLLPIAVNKLAGKELLHQKDTVLEAVTTEFIQTITPTKLDAMAQSGLFDKQQLILFSTILEQVTKRMVTAEEKAKKSELAQRAATNDLSPGEGG